jgi:hypothetical protein
MLTGAIASRFGSSLAVVAMIKPHLAVGASWYYTPQGPGVGAVHLYPTAPDGPSTVGSSIWTLDTPGMPGPAMYSDYFGTALKPILLGDDITYPYHLAITATGRESGAIADAGGLFLLRGTTLGPTATGSQYIDPAALTGGAVVASSFGLSLG